MPAENSQRYDPMRDRAARPSRLGSQFALAIGFGGVLILMGIAGVDSIRVLHRLEVSQSELSRGYLTRNEILSKIRADIYRSGNIVRDALLAGSEDSADSTKTRLLSVQQDMEVALAEYSVRLGPSEQELFQSLQDEVSRYWQLLLPVSEWDSQEGLARREEFLTEEAPHRRNLTEVLDKIDVINQGVVDASVANSAELFNSFRLRAFIVLALVVAVGAVLAGFSTLHIRRLEREARLRYEEIVRAREELETLSARIVAAQEEERRTISREMHDEVGQSLSALLVDLGNLAANVPEDDSEVQKHLNTARLLAESSLRSVRNMALLLRPSMLDDLGLVPALHWQAREVSRRSGLDIEVAADTVPDDLPDKYRTCVYRVVQEALHNAERHALATSVQIEASMAEDRLLLSVRDDGSGFDAGTTRGVGLLGMEERVRHMGGKFHVESQPGAGTKISIELPLEAAVQTSVEA